MPAQHCQQTELEVREEGEIQTSSVLLRQFLHFFFYTGKYYVYSHELAKMKYYCKFTVFSNSNYFIIFIIFQLFIMENCKHAEVERRV